MENIMCYGDFAYVYDALTDDVEYQKRADYVEKLIEKHLGRKDNLICDLGCGTGTVCTLLQKRGHDCIGIDNSDAMLNVAAEKNTDNSILYLNQDICQFELYGTVDVFLSMLDTVNYITDTADIEELFRLVNNYLNPGGIFIFDDNTLFISLKIFLVTTRLFLRKTESFILGIIIMKMTFWILNLISSLIMVTAPTEDLRRITHKDITAQNFL